ncbi:indole-3-glycerol phosphate synthase TrpC, partial [Dehalococcoidales bacterium]|nr:indole-3-glycerol phosphate synthase TrpC [Dehalococcoidales bacterium]
QKREEVEQRKKALPLSYLEERIAQRKPPLDFGLALEGSHTRLIAEVKRASPLRGVFCPNFNPVELAKTYAQGGASAISVLTETNYFDGNLNHLTAIRQEVGLPLLRKDFIFDQYQIYESAAYGADALLLIVSILSQEQLEELLSLSRNLGLSCLVEVHNKDEVERALLAQAKIIGINNRDLNTFTVDINTTRRLRPLIPQEQIVVSQSGISSREDIEKLKGWGVNAVLVGEALVTADDILTKMREIL